MQVERFSESGTQIQPCGMRRFVGWKGKIRGMG
jgi:hypothetical protein